MPNKKGSDSKPAGYTGDVIKQGEPKYVPQQGGDKYSPTKPEGTKAPKTSK